MGMIKGFWRRKAAPFIDGLTIQGKLIVSYVFIILIPVVFFSWYLFNEMYENTIAESGRKNEYMLEIEKNNILNNLELMERTAQIAYSDKEVQDYLQADEEQDPVSLMNFSQETMVRLQNNLLFSNPNIANIRMFTANPNVEELWPIIFRERRIAGKPWLQTVKDLNGTVRWEIGDSEKEVMQRYAENTPEEKETYVTLLRELKNADDSYNGILEVDMRIDNFFSKIFSTAQEQSSQMLVFDRYDRVYTNTGADFFRDVGVNEIRSRFLELGGDKKETRFSFSCKGHPYIADQIYIDRLDVHVLSVVSLKKPISEISAARNKIIVALLILTAVLSVMTYFLHALILKKLNSLRDSMKKASRGDFNIDVPFSGTDEVGELAHHFRRLLRKINELIVDAVNKQAATKEAEIKSLKNQIDSHFLYNTLENLKMLAEIEGQYTISDALTSLGGMMRYNLKWTSNHVRLRDEISHIQNYIAIMNVRYDGMLNLMLDVPPGYLEQEVLKMSLQPIVENAVKYGMSRRGDRGRLLTIRIRAHRQKESMLIEVWDDGGGIAPGWLEEINRTLHMDDLEFQRKRTRLPAEEKEGSGIGLRNVQQRIAMYYGREHGIRLESMEGEYTRVIMTIPYLILTGGLAADA